MTAAATSAMRSTPQRSLATIESISPGCVESSSTPTVARTRCTRHGDRDHQLVVGIDPHDVGG